jgi:hypothetical protein
VDDISRRVVEEEGKACVCFLVTPLLEQIWDMGERREWNRFVPYYASSMLPHMRQKGFCIRQALQKLRVCRNAKKGEAGTEATRLKANSCICTAASL